MTASPRRPRAKRAEAVGIADRNQPILRHQRERKRTLHVRNGLDDRIVGRHRARSRIQVQNHFGIGARLEDRAMTAELVFELAGVHEIAVVGDGNLPVHALNQNRLRVVDVAVSGGRIAHVPDRDSAPAVFRASSRKTRRRRAPSTSRCAPARRPMRLFLRSPGRDAEARRAQGRSGWRLRDDRRCQTPRILLLSLSWGPTPTTCASRTCGRSALVAAIFCLVVIWPRLILPRPMQLAA